MLTRSKTSKFRVIVGVDFGEGGAHAIFESVQLARLMPCIDVHFVHVAESPADLHDAQVLEALNERLARIMIRLERYVRDALFTFGGNEGWGCDVAFHVRAGAAAREILRAAVEVDAEMIIVGADQVSGLRKLYHRSTAEQLVRAAQVPVVVAHQKNFRPPRRAQAESSPDRQSYSGLTSYSYVDFGEPRRDSHLSGGSF
jgi:nucleotide-binding universal stress UspA family protein